MSHLIYYNTDGPNNSKKPTNDSKIRSGYVLLAPVGFSSRYVCRLGSF